jgi:hypothetical protein
VGQAVSAAGGSTAAAASGANADDRLDLGGLDDDMDAEELKDLAAALTLSLQDVPEGRASANAASSPPPPPPPSAAAAADIIRPAAPCPWND